MTLSVRQARLNLLETRGAARGSHCIELLQCNQMITQFFDTSHTPHKLTFVENHRAPHPCHCHTSTRAT